MPEQYETDRLKRQIRNSEKFLAVPLWKTFLLAFTISVLLFGGTQILLLYKEDVDLTAPDFLAKLFVAICINAVLLTVIPRYFTRRGIVKTKRKLVQDE